MLMNSVHVSALLPYLSLMLMQRSSIPLQSSSLQSSYQLLRSTLLDLPDGVEHVVVLSGVPVVFPSIPMSEAILGSMKSMMKKFTTCRSIGKSFNILDRFDQPEILDDLLDGWAAKVHTEEKLRFIRMLQEAAQAKEYRITILSGDAHVGGVGRLYSRPKKEPRDDPLFMPQVRCRLQQDKHYYCCYHCWCYRRSITQKNEMKMHSSILFFTPLLFVLLFVVVMMMTMVVLNGYFL